jgi:hypothetical protein
MALDIHPIFSKKRGNNPLNGKPGLNDPYYFATVTGFPYFVVLCTQTVSSSLLINQFS